MLAEYERKSNIGIAVGLVMQVVGALMPADPALLSVLGLVLLLGGIGTFCWGCICYARGKGRSGAWGVLGVTSLLGLIILVLLPDANR